MKEIICYDSDMDGIATAFIYIKKKAPIKYELLSKKKAAPLLLEDIFEKGIKINLFDQSISRNYSGILRELEKGNKVYSVDHHDQKEILHQNFKYLFHSGEYHCTASLMDLNKGKKYPLIVLAAALSDNVKISEEIIKEIELAPSKIEELLKTAKLITFNSMNLIISPEIILGSLIEEEGEIFSLKKTKWYNRLEEIFQECEHWLKINPPKIKRYHLNSRELKFYILKDEPNAKEIFATYATDLQKKEPNNIHIIFAPNGCRYCVSIRAPFKSDQIAKNLFNGNGHKTAAGGNFSLEESLINDRLSLRIAQLIEDSKNE